MGVQVKPNKKEQNVFWQEGSSKPKQFFLSHNQCHMLMCASDLPLWLLVLEDSVDGYL